MKLDTDETIVDFGPYALNVIHKLQRHVKELQADIEAKDKELDMAEAKIDALLNEVGRR